VALRGGLAAGKLHFLGSVLTYSHPPDHISVEARVCSTAGFPASRVGRHSWEAALPRGCLETAYRT
jgi:hypothetical protein